MGATEGRDSTATTSARKNADALFAIIARFQKIDAKETEKRVNDAFAGVDDIHEVYTTNSRSPQELTQAASKTQTRKPQSTKL